MNPTAEPPTQTPPTTTEPPVPAPEPPVASPAPAGPTPTTPVMPSTPAAKGGKNMMLIYAAVGVLVLAVIIYFLTK